MGAAISQELGYDLPHGRMLGLPAMEAAQALADLTEISSQIEAAVLADADGSVIGSTLPENESAAGVARAAVELVAAADEERGEGAQSLVQVQAAWPDGSVFVVRDERHLVVAVTRPDPTVGLVFYDLKTCLRLVGEEPAKKPAAQRRRKKVEEESAKVEEESADGEA
jgi:predicted regulator of Ras-like GTPase activity (Roadblock/LC7/MglB family)